MAHLEQMFFIENIAKHLPEYFNNKKVLEVGSLNVNGSVRCYFKECDYLGVDISEGEGVDVICRGEDFGGGANSFDVVISTEMFEHNAQWIKCWLNMLRVLKEDGLMIFTCASLGRKQHGTARFEPQSSPLTVAQGDHYYKNLATSDFESLVDLNLIFEVFSFYEDRTSGDLYFFGIGKKSVAQFISITKSLILAFDNYYYNKNVCGDY